jgi:hypothetical protein
MTCGHMNLVHCIRLCTNNALIFCNEWSISGARKNLIVAATVMPTQLQSRSVSSDCSSQSAVRDSLQLPSAWPGPAGPLPSMRCQSRTRPVTPSPSLELVRAYGPTVVGVGNITVMARARPTVTVTIRRARPGGPGGS